MTNDAANIEYDGIERISILNAFHEDLESTLEIVEILMELINGDPEMTEKEGRKYEYLLALLSKRPVYSYSGTTSWYRIRWRVSLCIYR